MTRIIQLNNYNTELKRNTPINFNHKDEELFKHEFIRQIKIGTIKILNNRIINSDFLVFSISGFEQQSFLYRNHFKPNRYSSLKFLLKNLLFIPKSKISKGIWITDAWSGGYFHWFGDVMQKIFILKNNLEIGIDHVLLLPLEFKNYEFVTESLKSLGLKLKYIEKNELVLCQELITVTLPFQSGNYYDEVILQMNSYFRNFNTNCNNKYKSVYLSRNKASRRKILNDEELINNFNLLNINTLYMEELSWIEQVETFKNVETLISIHGAGLTNMLFMKPGSTIIEFRHPESNKQNCFHSLACALGHKYYYIIGDSNEEDFHLADLRIEWTEVTKLLNFE